jgi:hypothetical protein
MELIFWETANILLMVWLVFFCLRKRPTVFYESMRLQLVMLGLAFIAYCAYILKLGSIMVLNEEFFIVVSFIFFIEFMGVRLVLFLTRTVDFYITLVYMTFFCVVERLFNFLLFTASNALRLLTSGALKFVTFWVVFLRELSNIYFLRMREILHFLVNIKINLYAVYGDFRLKFLVMLLTKNFLKCFGKALYARKRRLNKKYFGKKRPLRSYSFFQRKILKSLLFRKRTLTRIS